MSRRMGKDSKVRSQFGFLFFFSSLSCEGMVCRVLRNTFGTSTYEGSRYVPTPYLGGVVGPIRMYFFSLELPLLHGEVIVPEMGTCDASFIHGYVAQLSLFLDGGDQNLWMIKFRAGFRCSGGNLNVQGDFLSDILPRVLHAASAQSEGHLLGAW